MKKLVLWLLTLLVVIAVPAVANAQLIRGRDPSGNARAYEVSSDGLAIANSTATVFASAVRTSSANSTDQTNSAARGVVLHLDITAASGTLPSLDVKVQAKDPVSGVYVDLPGAAFAQKIVAGSDTLTVYPGVTEATGRLESAVLPRTWRVVATIAGTGPSFTFSLAATYVQ